MQLVTVFLFGTLFNLNKKNSLAQREFQISKKKKNRTPLLYNQRIDHGGYVTEATKFMQQCQLLNPNKEQMINALNVTFDARRNWITSKNPPCCNSVIEKYQRFLDMLESVNL